MLHVNRNKHHFMAFRYLLRRTVFVKETCADTVLPIRMKTINLQLFTVPSGCSIRKAEQGIVKPQNT